MSQLDADSVTVTLLQQGDQEGLLRLLHDHGALIKAKLRKDFGRVLDDSEVDDAMQAMLLRVWQAAVRFDPRKGTLRAWATVIARNCALRIIERRRRQAPPGERNLDAMAAGDVGPILPASERQRLRRDLILCIEALPRLQREVLLADHRCGGIAAADALAAQFGTTPNSIYVSRQKARKTLRTALLALGHDVGPAPARMAPPRANPNAEPSAEPSAEP
jgi:RNA polymerase sigma-70 factor (ECF subfamily)